MESNQRERRGARWMKVPDPINNQTESWPFGPAGRRVVYHDTLQNILTSPFNDRPTETKFSLKMKLQPGECTFLPLHCSYFKAAFLQTSIQAWVFLGFPPLWGVWDRW